MANIHWTILADNESDRQQLFKRLLLGHDLPKPFENLKNLKGGLLSQSEIDRYIEEEVRHDLKILTKGIHQPLKTLSSGERKKALLEYLLRQNNEFLVLDNPLDNLDTTSREALIALLAKLALEIPLIQVITRKADKLSFPCKWAVLSQNELLAIDDPAELENKTGTIDYDSAVPGPLTPKLQSSDPLVLFNNVK
ncbi:MAG: ABC transporter, partial [Eudoraea sp.]|nr:ABC transporter [Eudoraea sp.]